MKGFIIVLFFISCSLALASEKAERQPQVRPCTDCGCKGGHHDRCSTGGKDCGCGKTCGCLEGKPCTCEKPCHCKDGHHDRCSTGGKDCGGRKTCGCLEGKPCTCQKPCHCKDGLNEYKGWSNRGWNKDCGCRDPCNCDQRNVRNSTCTRVINQKVHEHTIATCTRESYFDRLEYIDCYAMGTTCTGVLSVCERNAHGIWTGVRCGHDGKETREKLNAEHYNLVSTWNNGNARDSEVAKLCDCKCGGDTLRSQMSWIADEPIKGCCDKGVNHQTAVQLKVLIFGKCCSECYLVQGARGWKCPITNRNTGS